MGQVFSSTMVLDTYADLVTSYPFVQERAGALGGRLQIRKQPVGVAAGIIPWNVPLFIIALKLGPAMAAGVPIVLKPAPETPLDSYLFAEAVIEADIPPGVINIVPSGRENAEYILRHPGVDKVSFTGSTAVGQAHRLGLRRAAQAGDARARRQVGGDRARRRRARRRAPRRDGAVGSHEQRAGVRRTVADPCAPLPLRRGGRGARFRGRRARGRRPARPGHPGRPARGAASTRPRRGLPQVGEGRRRPRRDRWRSSRRISPTAGTSSRRSSPTSTTTCRSPARRSSGRCSR